MHGRPKNLGPQEVITVSWRGYKRKTQFGGVFGGADHSILRSGPGFELQSRTPRSIEKSELSISANFRNPEYPNDCNTRGDRNSAVAAKLSSHSCLRQLNHAGCTDGR